MTRLKKKKNMPTQLGTVTQHPDYTTITMHSPTSEHLDQCISTCLEAYEKLPTNDRPDNAYNHIISIFIQKYPVNDPLRTNLKDITNTNAEIRNAAADARNSAPTNYLNQSGDPSNNQQASSSNWMNTEQTSYAAHLEPTYVHPLHQSQINNLQKYSELISQRFKIKYRPSVMSVPNELVNI